jgi:alpha-ketoglutarate-dependent taurine dioxygenase
MAFTTTDLTPRIGTQIETDIPTLLSGKHAQDIRAILEQRGVIAFRELNMTDEEQVAFTKTLGTYAIEQGEEADGGVYKISMDAEVQPMVEYLKSAFYWHLDGTTSEFPILASIMSSKRLAPEGGQTEFCNTYAAYDDLPEEDKAAYADLKVYHSFVSTQRITTPEPSFEQYQTWRARGGNVLPLVWNHRSGRKSLVVGATTEYVIGMDPPDSLDLLFKLRAWATQPQFVYRHEWTLGDLVIWDNTGTLHRALPYDFASGRLMHRTKLAGEEPFYDTAGELA